MYQPFPIRANPIAYAAHLQDTAVLYYFMEHYGFRKTIEMSSQLQARPGYSNIHFRTDRQRHQTLNQYLKLNYGSGLETLALKSHQWYREHATQNLVQKPSIEERVKRNAYYYFPLLDRGRQRIKNLTRQQ